MKIVFLLLGGLFLLLSLYLMVMRYDVLTRLFTQGRLLYVGELILPIVTFTIGVTLVCLSLRRKAN